MTMALLIAIVFAALGAAMMLTSGLGKDGVTRVG